MLNLVAHDSLSLLILLIITIPPLMLPPLITNRDVTVDKDGVIPCRLAICDNHLNCHLR